MSDTLDIRLAGITPELIKVAIQKQAGDERPQALDAARLALELCNQAGIGAQDTDRALAYPLVLERIKASVEPLSGMRYVTGMT